MSNNNLADISVFESLQSDQYTKTNMSQMSVFNVDLKAMRTVGEDYIRAAQAFKKAREEFKKAGDKYSVFERLGYQEYARMAPDDPKAKEAKEYYDISRRVHTDTSMV
jgi:hypothetical protein